ncbi:Primase zinc finger, partial [Rhizoctonia solani]
MQSRTQDASSNQEEIRRQIAALQAQLLPSPERTKSKPAEEPSGPTKRVLVAGSPSPKRRKLQHDTQLKSQNRQEGSNSGKSKPIAAPAFKPPSPPRVSAVAAAASAFQTNRTARIKDEKEPVVRSTSFAQPLPVDCVTQTRNDDMTVKEELPLGPIDHPASFDDPRWERREPYSGIHLSSRKLPFEEFQEFMYGRVYLSPSKLYSVARLSPDRSGYDVPVEGDWVTIAVVAERGQVQVSKRGNRGAPQGKRGDNSAVGQNAGEDEDEDSRPSSREKKYMRLLLVDFGHRASEEKPAPKEQTKGDALLNMLLFEADSAKTEDGQATRSNGRGVTYKGGSGGAFEACAKLREGAVLAILNPRILKPFQRNTGNPHPRDNALAITPENAESIAVLGYSRDLGSCRAIKRDGKPCGSWCDKRISDVCEYHIQDAIKSKRAARPEFSAGTMNLSSLNSQGGKGGKSGKPAYDPSRKWGLTPSAGQQNAAASSESARLGGGATYVVDGRVFSGFDMGGIDADAARLKGLRKKKEEELAIEEIIRKDGGKTPAARILKMGAAHLKSLDSTSTSASTSDVPDDQLGEANETPRKVYSADLVKSIGFDPSRRSGNNGRPKEGGGVRQVGCFRYLLEQNSYLFVVQLVAKLDRSVILGPAPGSKRMRSNVTSHFAPSREKEAEDGEKDTGQVPGAGLNLDSDSDSDLEIED